MKKLKMAGALIALGCAGAEAASVNLPWTAPTTRADGSTLSASEIAGYEITQNGVVIATPAATATSYTQNIAAGNCVLASDKFAIRVKDTAGAWSAYSATASLAADQCTPKPAPAAPTLRVTAGQ